MHISWSDSENMRQMGEIVRDRNPVTLSATPPDYPLPPPALDEHGAEVRAWLTGPAARPPASPVPDTGESR